MLFNQAASVILRRWFFVCCVKQRGHLVADVDPLGIVYADLHSAYEQRGASPSAVVVRDHMLGNLALGVFFFPWDEIMSGKVSSD